MCVCVGGGYVYDFMCMCVYVYISIIFLLPINLLTFCCGGGGFCSFFVSVSFSLLLLLWFLSFS